MEGKRIRTLTGALDGATVRGTADVGVSGICCDSRRARPGYLFVALEGTRRSGCEYAEDAVRRGAAAVVAERELRLPPAVCRIRVPDARAALAVLSAEFYGHPSRSLTTIGITGTNGKTTTAYAVCDVLETAGWTPGMIGTVEYRIGTRTIPASRTTPDAPALQSMLAQMRDGGCRAAILEVSSHALDQERTRGIAFDACIFTNLSRDHLDYHGSLEAYFEAKIKLFEHLATEGKAGALAVINRDDDWGRRLLDRMSGRISCLGYGMQEGADVRAEEVFCGVEGCRFRMRTPWGNTAVRSRLPGRFNVYNLLAAGTVCAHLGVPIDQLVKGMDELSQVPGRLERIPNHRGFQVFVDYAHTDAALAGALRTLRELGGRRVLLVFGCGGDRDRGKRPAMGEVAARLADLTVLTSDNPRSEKPLEIIEDIRRGFGSGGNAVVVEDRREAIREALRRATEGDVILVAGKGHERFQEFANTTVPFDDRRVVAELLEEL